MKIAEFQSRFASDATFQAKVIEELNSAIQNAGISTVSNVVTDTNGTATSVKLVDDAAGLTVKMAASAAAIKVLQEQGLTDISNIAVYDPNSDPAAWNVVYKDGGWIANGIEENGLVRDSKQ